jgi:hypothetical protein
MIRTLLFCCAALLGLTIAAEPAQAYWVRRYYGPVVVRRYYRYVPPPVVLVPPPPYYAPPVVVVRPAPVLVAPYGYYR